MERLAPLGPVYQAGTLSGNPVAMAAGLATLEAVSRPGFHAALAAATGNVAALHRLDAGVIARGREADLLIMDAPLGSQADDALGALAIGDTPAVVTAIIDGVPRFTKSRNTPPAIRPVSFTS